jgi:uncharacterized membrane protein YwaF
MLVHRYRPYPSSLLRVIIWTELYFIITYTVDSVTGVNYGFLLHQPEAFSLLSYLSKSHFIYIIEFHLLAWVFFSALYAPFAFWDLFRKRAAPQLEPARPRAGLR